MYHGHSLLWVVTSFYIPAFIYGIYPILVILSLVTEIIDCCTSAARVLLHYKKINPQPLEFMQWYAFTEKNICWCSQGCTCLWNPNLQHIIYDFLVIDTIWSQANLQSHAIMLWSLLPFSKLFARLPGT